MRLMEYAQTYTIPTLKTGPYKALKTSRFPNLTIPTSAMPDSSNPNLVDLNKARSDVF